ncbi:MAG: hypothetical protein JWM76_177 [Pseudonocardiales bacterium]|nr:hypothetical protein [Pseudonocardiales bacterium]
MPTVSTTPATLTCAISSGLSVEELQAALSARTLGVDVVWDVLPTRRLPAGTIPAIALCDAALVSTMTHLWPECTVVAIVPTCDDGTGVIAALQAGAASCVRGENPAITAAFILAVARRRGLVPEDHHR